MSDGEMMIEDDAAYEIGTRVIEAADRVSKMNKAVPGARAVWNFEMDETRYRIEITIADK